LILLGFGGLIIFGSPCPFKKQLRLLLKYQQNLEVEKYPPEQHASGGPIDSSLAERKTDVRRRFKVELFCQSMWKIEVGSAQ